jgi:hydrogenase expression/formation protein HypC
MCLAVPAQIESINGQKATVALGGNRFDAILALVPEAKVGDWVLVHAGLAITVLDEKDAMETYELLAEMAELDSGEGPEESRGLPGRSAAKPGDAGRGDAETGRPEDRKAANPSPR